MFMLLRDCSYDILGENVTAFCPCLKSLPEAKVKSFGLISLAEEISKQPSIDFVMGLLVLTLMKIHNKKEQTEQEKYVKRKRSTRKRSRAKFSFQGEK